MSGRGASRAARMLACGLQIHSGQKEDGSVHAQDHGWAGLGSGVSPAGRLPSVDALAQGPVKAVLFGGEAYGPSTYYSDLWEVRAAEVPAGGLMARAGASLAAAGDALLDVLGIRPKRY